VSRFLTGGWISEHTEIKPRLAILRSRIQRISSSNWKTVLLSHCVAADDTMTRLLEVPIVNEEDTSITEIRTIKHTNR